MRNLRISGGSPRWLLALRNWPDDNGRSEVFGRTQPLAVRGIAYDNTTKQRPSELPWKALYVRQRCYALIVQVDSASWQRYNFLLQRSFLAALINFSSLAIG